MDKSPRRTPCHASKVTLDLYYKPEADTRKRASEQIPVLAPVRLGVLPASEETEPAPPVAVRLRDVLEALLEATG